MGEEGELSILVNFDVSSLLLTLLLLLPIQILHLHGSFNH